MRERERKRGRNKRDRVQMGCESIRGKMRKQKRSIGLLTLAAAPAKQVKAEPSRTTMTTTIAHMDIHSVFVSRTHRKYVLPMDVL